MMKMAQGVLTYYEWIALNAGANAKIGFDPKMIPASKNFIYSLMILCYSIL